MPRLASPKYRGRYRGPLSSSGMIVPLTTDHWAHLRRVVHAGYSMGQALADLVNAQHNVMQCVARQVLDDVFQQSRRAENRLTNRLMRKPMILFKMHNDPINWDAEAMMAGPDYRTGGTHAHG